MSCILGSRNDRETQNCRHFLGFVLQQCQQSQGWGGVLVAKRRTVVTFGRAFGKRREERGEKREERREERRERRGERREERGEKREERREERRERRGERREERGEKIEREREGRTTPDLSFLIGRVWGVIILSMYASRACIRLRGSYQVILFHANVAVQLA